MKPSVALFATRQSIKLKKNQIQSKKWRNSNSKDWCAQSSHRSPRTSKRIFLKTDFFLSQTNKNEKWLIFWKNWPQFWIINVLINLKLIFSFLICFLFRNFFIHRRCVNYDVIDKYGQYIKSKGIQCVLVNGVTGEGTCLRFDEHKRLAEEWLKTCRKYGLHMVLCIGGCGIEDVYGLCEHADKIGVDCIVLMPDLFYKPKCEEDLVEYFKNCCKYYPKRPICYYHIPEWTNVKCKRIEITFAISFS